MATASQEIPDSVWIRRAQRGDREAFAPLVARYQRRVFTLVFHLVRRHDEVEDIAQEIFIKAFRGVRGYNFQSSFGTWLSRIAVNHCYDYLRREQKARVSYYWQMSEEGREAVEGRERQSEDRGGDVEQQIATRDLAAKLLARAPADDRVILALKELEDHSVEEISQILNLRPNTVKVRLHRARKRMLQDLEQWRKGR